MAWYGMACALETKQNETAFVLTFSSVFVRHGSRQGRRQKGETVVDEIGQRGRRLGVRPTQKAGLRFGIAVGKAGTVGGTRVAVE